MSKKRAARIAGQSAQPFTNNPVLGQAQAIGGNALSALASALGLGGGGAGGADDYSNYLQENPDVQQAYANLTDDDRQYLASQGYGSSPEDYARFHYERYGLGEGRQLGNGGAGAGGQQGALGNFLDSLGYNFQFDEGRRAVTASNAARGILDSGAFAKSLTRYGQGLAQQGYDNYLDRISGVAGAGTDVAQNVASSQQNAQLGRAGIEAQRRGFLGKVGQAFNFLGGIGR